MSELYRPANGTEGEGFYELWCHVCERDRAFREGDEANGCPIAARMYVFDTDSPEYPRELTYSPANTPVCTAYVEEGELIPVDREREADGQAVLFPEIVA